jgi:purine-binding chemotaxis protein CheW
MSALAVEPTKQTASRPRHKDMENRCFTVVAGGEIFGLPVAAVHTIFRTETVTPVPLGPKEVLGLVNLRGKIAVAVSLRRRLQMPDAISTTDNLAIGIEHRGESFALIVDEVGDVILLEAGSQIPSPTHLKPLLTQHTSAFHRMEKSILPILDLNTVFDFKKC